MLCDGSPDPLDTRELNTYINLWRDETECKPFSVVLREGEETIKVCSLIIIHHKDYGTLCGSQGLE